MIWCVIALATSLESNVPRMCFEDRETCRAFIQQLGLQPAQCERRQKG
mgnify:CR=1 FL=1